MIARTLPLTGSRADDPRLTAALEDYISAMESGSPPDREQFLEEHADIRAELAACLDGLDFVHCVAPQLKDDGRGPHAPLHGPDALPLGDYRILREVGRGGMGVVYEAQQLSLSRRVALKVLPLAAVLDPRRLQRFKNESLAAAQLEHPHIVSVYGVGCDRGVHYYAMKFIPGSTLAQVIRQLRRESGTKPTEEAADLFGVTLPPSGPVAELGPSHHTTARLAAASTENAGDRKAFFRSVAVLGRDVAHALDYAHQRGIVHRDIKPSNLMVDESGAVWVTDFGVAHIDGDAALTMSGDLLGTLRYMSPEQLLAKRAVLDHRTDIYSLGVTLYELLTLQPAFPQIAREELIRAISLEEPTPVRRLQRDIPDDLEVILLKATAKNPAARYDTAQELADDLQRFLDHQPIRAKRPTLSQRAAKWSRRHPALLMSSVAVLLVATVSLVVSSLLILDAKRTADANAQQARANLKNAREAVDQMLLRVSDRFKDEPQMEEVRTKLLEDALSFYSIFLQRAPNDPELQSEVIAAHLAHAQLRRELGQLDAAEQSCNDAIALAQELVTDEPQNLQYRKQLADCYWGLGYIRQPGDMSSDTVEAYRKALDISRQLAREAPSAYEAWMAKRLTNFGSWLQARRRDQEAEVIYNEAVAIRRKNPNDYRISIPLMNLGAIAFKQGKYDETESYFREALAILDKAEPSEAYRSDEAVLRGNLAVVLFTKRKHVEAEQLLRETITCYENLIARSPNTPGHRQCLARDCKRLGEVLNEAGRSSEAEEALRRSVTIQEELVAEYPELNGFHDLMYANHALLRQSMRRQQSERIRALRSDGSDGGLSKLRVHLPLKVPGESFAD